MRDFNFRGYDKEEDGWVYGCLVCEGSRAYVNGLWHMWYFRAIENYFPAKQYMAIGLDPTQVDGDVADWHYINLSSIPGYEKKDLSKLTKGMSYDDYEDGLQHFPVQGGLSEMQLFLLKLVRII